MAMSFVDVATVAGYLSIAQAHASERLAHQSEASMIPIWAVADALKSLSLLAGWPQKERDAYIAGLTSLGMALVQELSQESFKIRVNGGTKSLRLYPTVEALRSTKCKELKWKDATPIKSTESDKESLFQTFEGTHILNWAVLRPNCTKDEHEYTFHVPDGMSQHNVDQLMGAFSFEQYGHYPSVGKIPKALDQTFDTCRKCSTDLFEAFEVSVHHSKKKGSYRYCYNDGFVGFCGTGVPHTKLTIHVPDTTSCARYNFMDNCTMS